MCAETGLLEQLNKMRAGTVQCTSVESVVP